MKIVHFKAASGSPDSADWHSWRNQGIGGSDATMIASAFRLIGDIPPWTKPPIAVKLGLYVQEINAAMERGRIREESIRTRACQILDIEFTPMFGEMDAWPIMRASFDGVSLFDDILEIKCSKSSYLAAKNNSIPEYYLPQLAHQAMVYHGPVDVWPADFKIYFAAENPETEDIAIAAIHSNELREMAEKLYETEQLFWMKLEEFQKKNIPETIRSRIAKARQNGIFARSKSLRQARRCIEAAKDYLKEAYQHGEPDTGVVIRTKYRNLYDSLQDIIPLENVPNRYRKTVWTVRFAMEEETSEEFIFESVQEARERLHEAREKERLLVEDPSVELFKQEIMQLAIPIGGMYIDGVCVFSQENIDWKQYAEDNQIVVPKEKVEVILVQ